jgi:hypothetical protein
LSRFHPRLPDHCRRLVRNLWGDYVSENEALDLDGGYQPLKVVFNGCQPLFNVENHFQRAKAPPSHRFRGPNRQFSPGHLVSARAQLPPHQGFRQPLQNSQNDRLVDTYSEAFPVHLNINIGASRRPARFASFVQPARAVSGSSGRLDILLARTKPVCPHPAILWLLRVAREFAR